MTLEVEKFNYVAQPVIKEEVRGRNSTRYYSVTGWKLVISERKFYESDIPGIGKPRDRTSRNNIVDQNTLRKVKEYLLKKYDPPIVYTKSDVDEINELRKDDIRDLRKSVSDLKKNLSEHIEQVGDAIAQIPGQMEESVSDLLKFALEKYLDDKIEDLKKELKTYIDRLSE